MRVLKAVSVVVAVALLGAFAPLHADLCPFSEYSFTQNMTGATRAATLDSVIGTQDNRVGSEIIFNLVSGLLRIYSGPSGSPTSLRVRDSYDITGVPPGTLVTVTAELQVSGVLRTFQCSGGCGVDFFAVIWHGTDSQRYDASFEATSTDLNLPFSGTVSLPVIIAAGRPQIIEFELRAERTALIPVLGQAMITFSGLPPGATIVSCQGYGGIVPVRRASWGTLKTLYR
jgi:hypothetical protein